MWLTALETIRLLRPQGRRRAGTAGARRRPGPRRAPVVSPIRASEVFVRHPANPIITVGDLPYRANSVFNPGAGRVSGDTLLLIRVEDLRGISHLLVARSADGATAWRFDADAAASCPSPNATRRRSGAARTPA